MEEPRRFNFGVAGLIVLALTIAFATGFVTQRSVPGASAADPGKPGDVPAATASGGTSGQNGDALASQYADTFTADFAQRLGVDSAKVNSAFSAAANDTIDKLVTDNQITQDEANTAKQKVQGGLSPFLVNAVGALGQGNSGKGKSVEIDENLNQAQQAALQAAAAMLGTTSDQLMQQLQADGKGLAEQAAAHHVDVQSMKNAMLAAGRAKLDSLAHAGTITQTKADEYYRVVTVFVDKVTSSRSDQRDQTYQQVNNDVAVAAWEAAAHDLGLTGGDMKQALGQGKSLTDLAQQHNFDVQKLKSDMLAAGKTKLDSLVHAGTITQAQSDQQYSDLGKWIDSLLNPNRS